MILFVTTHTFIWYDIIRFEPHAHMILLLILTLKGLIILGGGLFTYESSYILLMQKTFDTTPDGIT